MKLLIIFLMLIFCFNSVFAATEKQFITPDEVQEFVACIIMHGLNFGSKIYNKAVGL